MEKQIRDHSVAEFLTALSSKAPIPGGGGAAALAGAAGNALGQMVANLTVGKKKYLLVEEQMQELLKQMAGLQEDFLKLADEDARVFAPLAKAYGLPANTEEEKAHKENVMAENLLAASLVPLQIMEKAVEMMDILEQLAVKGSVMAVSDVGVGIQFIRTALLGGVMNVLINTKSMKDRAKAEELNAKADLLMENGRQKADRIYEMVLAKLK